MNQAAEQQLRHVVSIVELNAPASEVWNSVGGFFTIHQWHPDIIGLAIPANQTSIPQLRRVLSFAGQAPTTEELVFMDNPNRLYRYRWHAGDWGERVKDYRAELQVIETVVGQRCLVRWASTFCYPEDALSQFYQNGFDVLAERFGLAPKGERNG